MTQIICCENHDGFAISCKGHAGYSVKGTDIVCAGISSLCCALLTTVSERYSSGYFSGYSSEISDGSFFIRVSGCKSQEKLMCMKILFDMFYNGVFEIAEKYRDYVSLSWCSEASLGKLTDKVSENRLMQKGLQKGGK